MSKACKAVRGHMVGGQNKKKDGSLLTFFAPQDPHVPPTVIAPPLVHPRVYKHGSASPPPSRGNSPSELRTTAISTSNLASSNCCTVAKQVLLCLHEQIKSIPDMVPLADDTHPLAAFVANPANHVSLDQDDWEDVLNPMMHRAFGYGVGVESREELRGLARRGDYSLDGFYRFMEYFVVHRRLQGGLLEGKVELLLAAIRFVPTTITHVQNLPQEIQGDYCRLQRGSQQICVHQLDTYQVCACGALLRSISMYEHSENLSIVFER